jgi:branched-chain amino acid transport system ATP-binding protein
MSQYVIQVENLTKAFGGLLAVDSVSLKIPKGERHVIIGPNGAGKTSLFHCISGVQPITSGTIRLAEVEVQTLSESARARLGIGRTFQISNVFSHLTVIENLLLALFGWTGKKWILWKNASSVDGAVEQCKQKISLIGLSEKAETTVDSLSYGEKRQLELGLALINNPKLLLLDEPCAGLSPSERKLFLELVESLSREITVLMIEHDMDVALALADRVTVLHRGRLVVQGTSSEIRENSIVRDVYFGNV